MNSNKREVRRLLEDTALLALVNKHYNKFEVLLDNGVNSNCFKSAFFEILIVRCEFDWITLLFEKYHARMPNFKLIQNLIANNNTTILKIFVRHGLKITQKHIKCAKHSEFIESIYDAQLKCNKEEMEELIRFL